MASVYPFCDGRGWPKPIGHDWLTKFHLDWPSINAVERGDLISVLDKHTEMFVPGLGALKGYQSIPIA